MFRYWRELWRDTRAAWRGLMAFNAMPRAQRRVVFYAETAADWAWLGPVADALEAQGQPLARVTSDPADPVLERESSFYVGPRGACTVLFRTVDADAFVLTLSDLDRFYLKRSQHPVHYFYIFHSVASMHRVYREHALDAYDTILCVGPHHFDEIRRTEEVYKLPRKRLLEHGYGRLDTLMQDLAERSPPAPDPEGRLRVLVAPTWGESSLIAHELLEPLLDRLLAADFDVTLRLHPMIQRDQPELVERLVDTFTPRGAFRFDPHINTSDSLLAADIMISEWSGSPLEYAFARERPVIFIDTPPKTFNPQWHLVGLPCLEEEIRGELGQVISPRALNQVPEAVHELVREAEDWAPRIRKARDAAVFNIGASGEVGAQHILGWLRENTSRQASSQAG